MGFIANVFRKPNSSETTVALNFDAASTYFDYAMMNKITDALVEKAVEEIWNHHGAAILRKVDKKTIGNLTVKKLATLIAKEITADATRSTAKSAANVK